VRGVGQRHNDRCGPVAVAHIVLNHNTGARSALLMPHHGSSETSTTIPRKTLRALETLSIDGFKFLHRARFIWALAALSRGKFRFKSLSIPAHRGVAQRRQRINSLRFFSRLRAA